MRTQDLHEFTRHVPFRPFRIHTTDGQTYDIVHPDQAIPLKSRVIIGMPDEEGVLDRSEHVSLFHITRIDFIESGDPPRKNGTTG